MALPGLRLDPYVKPYVGSVLPEFSQAVDTKINQYETAREFDDVLAGQADILLDNTLPFEGDRKIATSLIDNARTQIEERAQKGNFEDMVRSTRQAARKFARDVQPLIQNKKLYSDYVSSLENQYSKGDITLEEKQGAINASTRGYRGLDSGNVQGSYFKGYNLSPSFDSVKFLDDVIKGWQSDKSTTISIPDETGRYITKKVEQASPDEIKKAAYNALMGNNKYRDYFQTRGIIGLGDKVQSEALNSIDLVAEKYGFRKTDLDASYIPEYAQNSRLGFNPILDPASSTVIPPINNPFNEFNLDENGFGVDPTKYRKVGNEYIKYLDEKGNIIDPSIVEKYERNPSKIEYGDLGKSKPYDRVIKYSPSELEGENKKANQFLQDISYVTNEQDILEAQQNGQDISSVKEASKEQISKRYAAAIENSRTLQSINRLSIVPRNQAGMGNKVVDSDEAKAFMTGKSIYIMNPDSDRAGFRNEQQIKDIESLLAKFADDGYSESNTKILFNGPLTYNPGGDKPGLSYTVIGKKQGEPDKIVEIAVERNDPQLQTLQNVNRARYNGIPTVDVPFYSESSISGQPIEGKFRVKTSPSKIDQEGKAQFRSMVQLLGTDENGNETIVKTIPGDKFDEFYLNIINPNAVNQYRIKK